MPRPLCFLTTFKIDDKTILLLGGCTKDRKVNSETTRTFKTAKVWKFDLLGPSFE